MAEKKKSRPTFENFGEYLYWAYANFQMLFAAFHRHLRQYNQMCYMIRAKYYKGYQEGRFQIRDLMPNNMAKLRSDNLHCWYCGREVSNPRELTIDHIFPRSKGGTNDTDNIFLVCKSCNSSKGNKDIIEWYHDPNIYPPLYIIAHYLKQIYSYAKENDLLDKHAEDLDAMDLPFNYKFIQLEYPQPEVFYDEGFELSDVKED